MMVDALAWELAQWEIHRLRVLLAQVLSEAQLAVRLGEPPLAALSEVWLERRRQLQIDQQRALTDQDYRRAALRPQL